MSWNRVAVVGAGLIKFGELFDQSYEQMAAGAFAAAMASVDKGFEPVQVEAAMVATQRGTLWGQEGIGGNTVPTALGIAGIPCTRIENACPSGSDAFRIGAMAVASGVHDVVLVIGVEKMRDKSTEEGLLARAASGHPVYTRGESAPVLFAPFATRHMHEFGTTREMLASVAVKNHHNGTLDPYAHFRNEITIDDVLKSAPVCHPLHLLDCCPQTDGAAAVLLAPADRAHEFTDRPVFVAGFGVATPVAAKVLARDVGATLIGLGVINWMARNASGEVLRALLVGNVVVQALELLINGYEVVVGDLPTQAAGGLVIHLVLGAVFVIAMRSTSSRT